jgi:hypothetical protein
MTTNELTEQIEQLVRNHIESTRIAAAAAIERAFATTPRDGSKRLRVGGAGPCASRVRASAAPRRAGEELAALGEKFYAVLCRNPGETMTTLASQVGATPRTLQVAVARLKRAGRVRSVGQRQHTRYFPMTNTAAAAIAA